MLLFAGILWKVQHDGTFLSSFNSALQLNMLDFSFDLISTFVITTSTFHQQNIASATYVTLIYRTINHVKHQQISNLFTSQCPFSAKE